MTALAFGPIGVKVVTSSRFVILVVAAVVMDVIRSVTFDLMEVLLAVNFEHVLRKSVQQRN